MSSFVLLLLVRYNKVSIFFSIKLITQYRWETLNKNGEKLASIKIQLIIKALSLFKYTVLLLLLLLPYPSWKAFSTFSNWVHSWREVRVILWKTFTHRCFSQYSGDVVLFKCLKITDYCS